MAILTNLKWKCPLTYIVKRWETEFTSSRGVLISGTASQLPLLATSWFRANQSVCPRLWEIIKNNWPVIDLHQLQKCLLLYFVPDSCLPENYFLSRIQIDSLSYSIVVIRNFYCDHFHQRFSIYNSWFENNLILSLMKSFIGVQNCIH